MEICERKILFWHLFDLKRLDIFEIADDLGYRPGYIDNVRTGRKEINDKLRFKIAKCYPSLTDFIIHGEPPELPECKTLIVQIWKMSGDDIEAIAKKTAYQPGYLRRIFNGSVKVSSEFNAAMMACYFPEIAKEQV